MCFTITQDIRPIKSLFTNITEVSIHSVIKIRCVIIVKQYSRNQSYFSQLRVGERRDFVWMSERDMRTLLERDSRERERSTLLEWGGSERDEGGYCFMWVESARLHVYCILIQFFKNLTGAYRSFKKYIKL